LAKKRLRNWAMFLVAASAWTGGIVTAAGATIPTTGVVNGVCYSLVLWKSHAAQMAFGIWYFLSFYVVILLIFVFCYGRILMAVRRQANAMAAHGVAESSTAQIQSKRIQTNVTKTTEHHSSISKKYFPLELSGTLDSLKPTQTTLRPTSQKNTEHHSSISKNKILSLGTVSNSGFAQDGSDKTQTNVTKTMEHHSGISKNTSSLELSQTLDVDRRKCCI